jgi:diguanylate cyclase (GGDEF)-like protein/PAS domain S-box-containing protein
VTTEPTRAPESTPSGPPSAWWHWWLPGLVAAIAIWTGFGPLQRLDLLAFDLISSLVPTSRATPTSVIVAIDERSLQQLGRWPWPRRIHAQLLERLHDTAPKAIAFAVMFDQPDAQDVEGDASFAAAIARSGRVVLPVAPTAAGDGASLRAAVPAGALDEAVVALGHVDVEIDPDGILRRLYLRAGVGPTKWSALAQALAEMPQPGVSALLPGLRSRFDTPAASSTWRRDYEVLLQLDPKLAIEQVSYVDVLNDAALAARLANRVVLVGATAAGIGSGFRTTVPERGGLMPAVEVHARAFEALRAGDVITPLDRLTILLLTVIAIGAGVLTHRRYRRKLPAVELLVIGFPLLLGLTLLIVGRYWYPPVGATLALAAGYLLWAAERFRHTWSELFLTQRRAEVTLNAVADGVASVDRDSRIEFINPVAQTLLGHSTESAKGKTIASLLAEIGASADAVQHALARCFEERRTIQISEPVWLDGAAGRVVRVAVGPILGAGGKVEGAVLALSDITEAVAASERLHHQATHDAMTDLPNRILVRDRIEIGIAGALRNNTSVGVMFVDLDDFKRINDSFGHHVGDRVLCAVAARLKSACRASDTVGRWGGDEFVIVLSELPSAEAIEFVARKLLAVLSEPMGVDDMSFHLTATIGISRGPQDSSDPDQLLGMADTAMYRVKQRSGGNYGFASAEMSMLSRQRMEIESGLRDALKNNELVVFYQPQIEIGNGTLTGFEALVRWNRPGHGLVLPATFIPVAEESDLILQLGNWVFDQVARQIRLWLDEGLAVVPVAINVSARQCLGNGLVRDVSTVLDRHGIPPDLIELEITETTAMKDVEHVESLLAQLKAIGVRVALDDFGTGYSSLSHLRRFPITVLKIDQSFVWGATSNADDAAIARATIALAHNLGLKVIGEGVETEGQRDFLAAQACDIAQGYYYGRPNPAQAMRELMAPRSSDAAAPAARSESG